MRTLIDKRLVELGHKFVKIGFAWERILFHHKKYKKYKKPGHWIKFGIVRKSNLFILINIKSMKKDKQS